MPTRSAPTARDQRTLLDIEQAAHRLGVTVRWIRRAIAERRIPFIKVGHLIRFESDELEAYIDSCRVDRVRW